MARFTRDGRLSRCCGKRMPSKNCSITSRRARPVVTVVTPALSDLVSARATPLRLRLSNGSTPTRQSKRKSQKNKKKNLRKQKKKLHRRRRNLRQCQKRRRHRLQKSRRLLQQRSRNLKNESGSAGNQARRNNFVLRSR